MTSIAASHQDPHRFVNQYWLHQNKALRPQ